MRLIALLLVAVVAYGAHAEPFTYQGFLQDNGSPANGSYDIQAFIYDDAVGGLSGGSQTFSSTEIQDGLFTIELSEFLVNPDARWLELRFRPSGDPGAYTTLAPRTLIRAAPFATHAFNAYWEQVAPDRYTLGAGNDVVLINRPNRIGAEYFGFGAVGGGFAGMYISTTESSGRPFYGYSAGLDIDAYHYFNGNNDRLTLHIGGGDRVTVDGTGTVRTSGDLVASDFEYTAPKTRYKSVSGNAFTNGSNDGFFAFTAQGPGIFPADPQSVSWFIAPLELPDGATITELQGVLYDNSKNGALTLEIRRQSLTSGGSSAAIVASVTTSGLADSTTNRVLVDTSIANAVVDNSLYSYFYYSLFTNASGNPPTTRLVSGRVEYTVDGPE